MNGTEYLLDTNMVIGLLKGQVTAIALAARAGLAADDKISVSQISRMELLGFSRLTNEEDSAIRTFFATCHVYMLDERVEAQAIQLRRSGTFKRAPRHRRSNRYQQWSALVDTGQGHGSMPGKAGVCLLKHYKFITAARSTTTHWRS